MRRGQTRIRTAKKATFVGKNYLSGLQSIAWQEYSVQEAASCTIQRTPEAATTMMGQDNLSLWLSATYTITKDGHSYLTVSRPQLLNNPRRKVRAPPHRGSSSIDSTSGTGIIKEIVNTLHLGFDPLEG